MSRPTPASPTQDTSLDTLLDDIDADLAEVRAVREVHAAARRDFEQDLGGNAILQAIEDAERDLLLGSPAATEEAMDSSLDSAVMAPKRRLGKAAA